MKRTILILICLSYSVASISQLTVRKREGNSVVSSLGMGVKINDGSSLKREQITINDSTCPIQLSDIGIETYFNSSKLSFKPNGDFITKEPIVAYEVVHLIYNVFGEHIKSLSNTAITDIDGQSFFSKYSSWYASERNVSEYLICVSYVSNVRTKSGKVWHYNFKVLKEQLNQLEFIFEEGFTPKKDSEKWRIKLKNLKNKIHAITFIKIPRRRKSF